MKVKSRSYVMGATSISGKRADGSSYSFSQVFVVNPLTSEITENRSVVGIGNSTDRLDTNDTTVRSINDYVSSGGKLPHYFETELDIQMNANGNRINVLSASPEK